MAKAPPAPRKKGQKTTDWRVAVTRALGGRATPSVQKFLTAWWKIEGGDLTNSAHYNWLNTTHGQGYPAINSVGVKSYPSFQTGVQQLTAVLRSGYPSLTKAIRSGSVDLGNPGVQADLNRWLTGNRTPGMTDYVRKIASNLGVSIPATGRSSGEAFASPLSTPDLAPPVLSVPPYTGPMDVATSFGGSFFKHGGFHADVSPIDFPLALPPPMPVGDMSQTLAPSQSPQAHPGPWKNWVSFAPNADRHGVHTNPMVPEFVAKIAQMYGKKLTIGTGTNHNQYVAGTHRQSDHWTGDAADIPMTGAALTRLGQTALIAAGMSPQEAHRQKGGAYHVNGYNILFNTYIGGNHWNHLHVGLGARPGSNRSRG